MATRKAEDNNSELGKFLQVRRSELTPDEVGLPEVGHHRRVSGLRREEVAQLASISPDYYTRLEQGRLSGASISALDAIARALRLTPDQVSYLYQLAGKPTSLPKRAAELIAPQTRRLLTVLTDCPAMVIDRHMNVLAWNSMAAALYTDFSALLPAERNMMRLMFLDPRMRALHTDWSDSARDAVAFVRMDVAQNPKDRALQALVGELSVRDDDFRRWWASHSVAHKAFGTKRFHHTMAGDMTLQWQFLNYPNDPDRSVVIMSAEPGTPSHHALSFLASWTSDHPELGQQDTSAGEGDSSS